MLLSLHQLTLTDKKEENQIKYLSDCQLSIRLVKSRIKEVANNENSSVEAIG